MAPALSPAPRSPLAALEQGAPFSPSRPVSLAGAMLEPPVLVSQEGEGPLEASLLSLCWCCGLSSFLASWLLSLILPHFCFGWNSLYLQVSLVR